MAAGLLCFLPACRSDSSPQAASHEVQLCSLCNKPIRPGEEVVLVDGNGNRSAFRCVHCALTAQAAAAPPSAIATHSPLSKTAVTIRRDTEGWSITPVSAVILSLPEEAGECVDRHRVFPDRNEFQRYMDAHPELPRDDAVPYTIDRLAHLLATGLPQDGIRPHAPVQLLVVGMLTHLPFKEDVLPVIEAALEDVGDTAGARFVDATRPEGKAILSAHGIHEHSPVFMFLNDDTHVTLASRTIDLRGFPGKTWTHKDLVAALRQAAHDH